MSASLKAAMIATTEKDADTPRQRTSVALPCECCGHRLSGDIEIARQSLIVMDVAAALQVDPLGEQRAVEIGGTFDRSSRVRRVKGGRGAAVAGQDDVAGAAVEELQHRGIEVGAGGAVLDAG